MDIVPLTAIDDETTAEFFTVFQEWNPRYGFVLSTFVESLRALAGHPTQVFLAREKGRILGYVQVTKRLQLGFPVYVEIDQVLVLEKGQRKGIGSQLVEAAERWAREQGVRIVKLESELPRSGSHVFYEALGYGFTKASKFYEKKLT